MDVIREFIMDYKAVIDFFLTAFAVVISLLFYHRTRDIKYLKGAYEMITRRTPNYQEANPASGQKFDTFKPVYRLNKTSGELELTDEVVDINELVNSYKDVVIDEILQRFMPEPTVEENLLVERDYQRDKLDFLRESFEAAEELREKYNLSADLTPQQIFAEVQTRNEALTERLQKVEALKKVREQVNEKKDKTVVEASKSEELPQSGD